jgi:thiamine transport system substrate-binding protein
MPAYRLHPSLAGRAARTAAWIATGLLVAAFALACGDGETRTLVVLTHESFDVTDEAIEEFEREHNAEVEFIAGGDANELVNRAILNAGNPEGDVLFGVDSLSFQRAVIAGVFTEFEAARRDRIPADVRGQFGDTLLLTPIDYGWVDLNFDPAEGDPPATLEELTHSRWRGKLVVQDPATSSPGLQFLATTVAHFGEGGWQQFWRDLRANDVLVTFGWTDAYTTQFSYYGGDRPLVVSYTSSPAAEFFFAEGELEEPPTRNVIPAKLFRQVEAAAILDGTDNEDLSGEFIDFMLSDTFQRQIPETMFVYPVIDGLELPEWWAWADIEIEAATLEPSAEDIDRWILEWTEIMRR